MLRDSKKQQELFISGDIGQFIPEDHILKRVDKILDLSWLRAEVKELYCLDNGRPGIEPEAALRLMLAGLFVGIVHDRQLLREAQVHLAIRWFAGYNLSDTLPDHSSLTRIRQRWGADRFRRIFQRTVRDCFAAGLISSETVHVDATLIRANVSWESLSSQHADRVLQENDGAEGPDTDPAAAEAQRTAPGSGKQKRLSRTDPEATMSTSSCSYHLEPSYKQHTAVDTHCGVIVGLDISTGERSEGEHLISLLDQVERTVSQRCGMVTADKGYAHSANYAELEARDQEAVIPPQKEPSAPARIPSRRFKYDAFHQRVRCPGGSELKRGSRAKNGWYYRSAAPVCESCALRNRCLPATARSRSVLIVDGYAALVRARRKKLRGWSDHYRRAYGRHRGLVEGVHGEVKTQHGLRRAVRWGLEQVSIQAYLTAAVINLKRLAGPLVRVLRHLLSCCCHKRTHLLVGTG